MSDAEFKGLLGFCKSCEHRAWADAEENGGAELHSGWHDCPNCGSPMWAVAMHEVPWKILPRKVEAS